MRSRQLSQRSIRFSFYSLSGIYTLSASLIRGVNTLFLINAGLDIAQVFIANAAYTLGMMVFEIPTGVVADTAGRRVSFLMSLVVLALGTGGYLAAYTWNGGLLWFVITSIVLGLGFTFYSGAMEAWVVDALRHQGYTGDMDRIFSRGSMISGAAMLVGTVGGGFLGNINLSFPYIGRIILLCLVFIIAVFRMKEIGFTPHKMIVAEIPAQIKRLAILGIQFGWKEKRIRLLMIVSLIQFAFLSWGFYAWQPYFLELLGKNAVWVAGVVAALVSLSMIAGNLAADALVACLKRRSTILLSAALIATVASVGVGLTNSFFLAVALWLTVMFCSGAYGPVKQAYLHSLIPSEQRATIVSLDSLTGSAGGVVGFTGLGQLARYQSIGVAYVSGGLFTLLALPFLVVLRRIGGKSDRINVHRDETKDSVPPGIRM